MSNTVQSEIDEALDRPQHKRPDVGFGVWVRIWLTVVLLVASLFVILSRIYDAGTEYWAFGVVGTLVWYWLGWEQSRHLHH